MPRSTMLSTGISGSATSPSSRQTDSVRSPISAQDVASITMLLLDRRDEGTAFQRADNRDARCDRRVCHATCTERPPDVAASLRAGLHPRARTNVVPAARATARLRDESSLRRLHL